jgi:ribosomal protein L37AE/L43A
MKSVLIGGTRIRCPRCFGRNFKRDQHKWVCEGCGYESNGEDFADNTPEGCFPVTQEREYERFRNTLSFLSYPW